MAAAKTLFDKIWDRHAILQREDGATLLYIDRHLGHDGSPRAFEVLKERGLQMARDHTGGAPQQRHDEHRQHRTAVRHREALQ